MTQPRKELEALVKTGKYLFHGSGYKIDMLKPNQAYSFEDFKTPIPDDDPGVHATPNVDIAIFMAVINILNAPKGFKSSFSYNNGKISFFASKLTLDQVKKGAKGFVYVVDKGLFKKRNPIEYISYKPVEISKIIPVSDKDLPKNIELI